VLTSTHLSLPAACPLPDPAGFMSNRGRQNVASFLALDLGLDWRLGADHFESLLTDYDVCRCRRGRKLELQALQARRRCEAAVAVERCARLLHKPTLLCSAAAQHHSSVWYLSSTHCSRLLPSLRPCLPVPLWCSNWGNWVSAAGLTGGRVNKFNITKQSNVSLAARAARTWWLCGAA
jgi:hypothetical protein